MKAMQWINKLVLALALVGMTSALAETSTETTESVSGLRVNPVLGATSFNVSGLKEGGAIPAGSTSFKGGSMIGALVEYDLGWAGSSVESGLVYLETGSQISAFIAAVETTISYLSVPINWKVPVTKMADVPVHFKAGLMPSFLMGAKVQGTGLLSGAEADIKDGLNSFDLMAQVGFGGEYTIDDRFAVQVDAAYLRGFNKVDKNGGGTNQGLSLTAALAISI